MADRPLTVTATTTSASIIALLNPGEVVHVECMTRQFSSWVDRYAGNEERLDAIRNDRTLYNFHFYAMPAKEARERQRP